jgi:hydroxyacylglutathione hydrolase
MNLIALPAFSDNYIWMLHDGQRAVVVDPGESAPVIKALDTHGLELAAILVTHHHADHVGGIDDLRPRLQGPVYGPRRERIPEPFVALDDGDVVNVLGLHFTVIDVPGHTSGHIAYFTEEGGAAPILFCGDTLFSGGCGRLFEGTPAQMHHSLSRLAGLPGATRVCCAHEYTLSNLKFARAVEPVNQALTDYTAWCEAQRATGLPTLPSSITTERLVNPFLRCAEPGVALTAQTRGAPSTDPVAVLAALRQWKNEFR